MQCIRKYWRKWFNWKSKYIPTISKYRIICDGIRTNQVHVFKMGFRAAARGRCSGRLRWQWSTIERNTATSYFSCIVAVLERKIKIVGKLEVKSHRQRIYNSLCHHANRVAFFIKDNFVAIIRQRSGGGCTRCHLSRIFNAFVFKVTHFLKM